MKTIRESVINSVRDSMWSTVEVHVIHIVWDVDSHVLWSFVRNSVKVPVFEAVYRNFLLIENQMKVNK